MMADNALFELFRHDILEGDPKIALVDPLAIAISKSVARAYFGDERAMGRSLSTDTGTYSVTLVFDDLSSNSHIQYDALLSLARAEAFEPDAGLTLDLWNLRTYTYLMLEDSFDFRGFDALSDQFFTTYMREAGNTFGGSLELILEPFNSIHYYSQAENDEPRGSIPFLYVLGAAALIFALLASASILSLYHRGGAKGHAIYGSISRLFTVAGMLPLLFTALMVVIGDWVGLWSIAGFDYPRFSVGDTLISVLLVWLAAGALSIAIGSTVRTFGLRGVQLLGVLAFPCFLLVGSAAVMFSFLMTSQFDDVGEQTIGIGDDRTVFIPIHTANTISRVGSVFSELLQEAAIGAVGMVDYGFGEEPPTRLVEVESGGGVVKGFAGRKIRATPGYLDALGLSIFEGGRWQAGGVGEVLVNDSLVEVAGWSEPIGQYVAEGGGAEFHQVVGVFGDFPLLSLKEAVAPLILVPISLDFEMLTDAQRGAIAYWLVVRVVRDRWDDGISLLESRWRVLAPDHPFEYETLAERLAELYGHELIISRVLGYLGSVLVVISLFGVWVCACGNRHVVDRRWAVFRGPSVILALSVILGGIAGLGAAVQWTDNWVVHVDFDLSGGALLMVGLVGVGTIGMITSIWKNRR